MLFFVFLFFFGGRIFWCLFQISPFGPIARYRCSVYCWECQGSSALRQPIVGVCLEVGSNTLRISLRLRQKSTFFGSFSYISVDSLKLRNSNEKFIGLVLSGAVQDEMTKAQHCCIIRSILLQFKILLRE